MNSIRFLLAAALTASPALLRADTLKLKNGKVYEGTVTEIGDSYEIAIPMGKIVDHQTVKKADVAEFIRTLPDEKESKDLAALVPTADAMPASAYEAVLKEKIEPFLKKYPVSKFRAAVDSVAKTYREELARVKAGDLKLDGTWIAAEELKWNDYNVKAQKLLLQLRGHLKSGKPMEAYQAFSAIETGHVASTAYPKAVAEISKAMAKLEATLEAAATEQPTKVIERTKMLAGLTADKRSAVEAAIKEELTNFQTRLAEEKKNKIPLTTFYPYDLSSIKESMTGAKKEITRLAGLDLAKLAAVSTKFQAGLKDMGEKAYISARSNFEEVAKFHSKDETVKKMVESAKTAAATAPKTESGIPGTPGTATTPPSTPLPATGAVPAAKPAPAAAPKPTAAPKPAEPAAAPAAPPAEMTVSEPEPENNLPKFLMGGAGLLALVGILAKVLGKKKSED